MYFIEYKIIFIDISVQDYKLALWYNMGPTPKLYIVNQLPPSYSLLSNNS